MSSNSLAILSPNDPFLLNLSPEDNLGGSLGIQTYRCVSDACQMRPRCFPELLCESVVTPRCLRIEHGSRVQAHATWCKNFVIMLDFLSLPWNRVRNRVGKGMGRLGFAVRP